LLQDYYIPFYNPGLQKHVPTAVCNSLGTSANKIFITKFPGNFWMSIRNLKDKRLGHFLTW